MDRDKLIKEAMQFWARHQYDEFYRAVAYSGYKHATDKQHEVLADFVLHILDRQADEKNNEICRIADQTPGLYARDFGG